MSHLQSFQLPAGNAYAVCCSGENNLMSFYSSMWQPWKSAHCCRDAGIKGRSLEKMWDVSYWNIFPIFTGRAFVHPLMIREVSIPYCNNETTRDQSCVSNLNGDFEKHTWAFLENIFRSFVASVLYNFAFTNTHMINHWASRYINKAKYVQSNTDSIHIHYKI